MILSPTAAAYVADLIFGDPNWSWHPVRLMGNAISYADKRLPHTRVAGIFLALGLPLAVLLASGILVAMTSFVSWFVHVALIFFCLAGTDMLRHARAVISAIEKQDLPAARELVGRIVGRDTAQLDEAGVLRACIESTAESFNDGFFAPLCYAFLGGAPLALAYKAVSTLDSMVGYKNERYLEFGWASAKLDDLLNYVPARMSALLIAMVSAHPMKSFACAMSDGPSQPSPNSGWPEGAFAGALGIELGGPASYGGVPSQKAFLGRPEQPIDLKAAKAALGLFQRASLLAVILGELLCRLLMA